VNQLRELKSITMNTTNTISGLWKIIDIMDDLREKCPWDKSKPCKVYVITIEETYELGDAILDNDLVEVKKELGDLMLHLFFYAKIGSETKDFDIADVY
jgi:XTP/dITP diphosphohydrolase